MKSKRKVAVSKAKAPALILDPRNAKRHSDRNKKAIRQSLESVGPFRSIGAVRGVVKVGNGVYEAAQDLGLKVKRVKADRSTLVVVDRDDLTDAEADRAAMLDNIAADSSAFDYEAQRFAELVEGDALLKQMASEEAKYIAVMGQGREVSDPLAEWQGMPEFSQESKEAWKSIIVHFDSPDNLKNFAELVDQTITEKTKFIWYPKKERENLKALQYSES